MNTEFEKHITKLVHNHHVLTSQVNPKIASTNGLFNRYEKPILTAAHIPIHWRFDLNPKTNPFLIERFGINAVFNAGAIKWKGKYLLMPRVEGSDRKSFFAIAESDNGVDNFKFWQQLLLHT